MSFNFMAAVTICSDFGVQKIKSDTVSTVSPSICHDVMGPGSIFIFTILILLIHEHGIFLHLLVSSLISFTSVLRFSIYRSLVSLKVESEVAQLCPILCDSMDGSLSGSTVHGIFQARILEWAAISLVSLGIYIPKYFILFVAMVNGIFP